MKNWIIYVLLSTVAMCGNNPLTAQKAAKSYFFEGDEVVFEFDRRAYAKAIREGVDKRMDFSDLKIYEVVISGDFNNWSAEGWRMEKVSRYIYQLRKKIQDFNDRFTWDFKFLINGKYWVNPDPAYPEKKVLANDFLEETYDLDLYHIKPSPNGNTLFSLKGFRKAKEVILAGEFNGWNEEQLKMNRTESGWELRLDLPPGRYEYKFIADKEWLHDPANPNKVRNIHRTYNSVLFVNKLVAFKLNGFSRARKVILAGSFNNWNEKDTQMKREGDFWTISMELPGGKHLYKFIVDGNWMVDPVNPLKEKDREGNVNSVLIVR